jgi:uncharacterized protein
MSETKPSSAFESLRKLAKRELKAIRSGDTAAQARLRRTLPRLSSPPVLREVQHALARERGFASWAKLKEEFELRELKRLGTQSVVDEFLERACWFGNDDGPAKWQRAETIRERFPEIATAGLHGAVVCGALGHVVRLIEQDGSLVHTRAGPQGWEPLLFLCFSRLPNRTAAEAAPAVAKALLNAGADPNVYTTDGHNRFTAFCGVVGQGERRMPEHAAAKAIGRLLLEHGATPDQGQALYNEHLHSDRTDWLELLYEFGLDAATPFNCAGPDGSARPAFDYLLPQAAHNGHVHRLGSLLGHGANPNARSAYTNFSCYQLAAQRGDAAMLDLLLEHGATAEPLQGKDLFLVSCVRGEVTSVREQVAAHPEYLEHQRALTDSINVGNAEMVSLLLELGMSPRQSRTEHPLYTACYKRELADLLLAHGADPHARVFGQHSLTEAALWHRSPDMARYFARLTRDVFDAVIAADAELLTELLAESPARSQARDARGNTPLHRLPRDPSLAEPIIARLLANGADAGAENRDGQTPMAVLVSNDLDELTDLLEVALEARTPPPPS